MSDVVVIDGITFTREEILKDIKDTKGEIQRLSNNLAAITDKYQKEINDRIIFCNKLKQFLINSKVKGNLTIIRKVEDA